MVEFCPSGLNTGRRRAIPYTYQIRQKCDATIELDKVERRELLAAARDAGRALVLGPSATSLLGVLASCYGSQSVAKGLMVWPSNSVLEARTGQSERTLQRAIRTLREAGLIVMEDSGNGKRFARKAANGAVVEVFGFNLTPLYTRRIDLANTVVAIQEEERVCRAARQHISAARNEIMQIIDVARQNGPRDLAASLQADLDALAPPRSRKTPSERLLDIEERTWAVKNRGERSYYEFFQAREMSACARQNDGHKEPNINFSIEICQNEQSGANAPQRHIFRGASGAVWAYEKEEGEGGVQNAGRSACPDKGLPLDPDLWRRACPSVGDSGLREPRTLDEIAEAGDLLSYSIGASRDALQKTRAALGRPGYGLVALYVYQTMQDDAARALPSLRNPGGLFRSVAREIAAGTRDLAPELMAMLRRRAN